MGSKFCHRLSILIFAFSLLIGCGGSNTSDAEYLQQAKTAISDGDNTTATIQLKSALQANPENSEARYLLGLMHAENGYWLNAESELRKALELGTPHLRSPRL